MREASASAEDLVAEALEVPATQRCIDALLGDLEGEGAEHSSDWVPNGGDPVKVSELFTEEVLEIRVGCVPTKGTGPVEEPVAVEDGDLRSHLVEGHEVSNLGGHIGLQVGELLHVVVVPEESSDGGTRGLWDLDEDDFFRNDDHWAIRVYVHVSGREGRILRLSLGRDRLFLTLLSSPSGYIDAQRTAVIEPSTFWYWVLITLSATAGLLIAEYRHHSVGRVVLKTTAALGFLGAGLSHGMATDGFSRWISAGLALSVLGDLCLLVPTAGRAFLAGIGAFLLAHVAYLLGFWSLGIDGLGFGSALVLLVPCAWVLHRWLAADVPDGLVAPVLSYIAVITIMVAGAVGVWWRAPHLAGLVATAVLFMLSDVGVAMQRFKGSGFETKLWAQPAYFVAQLSFAWHSGWVS